MSFNLEVEVWEISLFEPQRNPANDPVWYKAYEISADSSLIDIDWICLECVSEMKKSAVKQ